MEHVRGSGSASWVLAVTALASFMVGLDALVVTTALTAIGREFHAPVEALEWTITAYILSFAVLQMTAAALGDRFGRRRVFVAGLMLFGVASAACASAPSIGWLIAARTLQGAGSAMVMPLAIALIGATFAPDQRARAFGIYSSVTGLSAVLGPIAGGAITQGLAWPWIFWLNVPLAAALAVASWRRVPESFGPAADIDFPGLAFATAAAFGFVWTLVRGNVVGWTSLESGSVLTLAIAAGVAFVGWELRSRAPMIPMRLFGIRTFAAGSAAMFALNGAIMGAIFFMAQFVQSALGEPPLAAGLRLLPYGLALAVVAPRSAAIARSLGTRSTIFFGLLIQTLGLGWLALVATPAANPGALIAPMVLAGGGFAAAITIVQQAVVGSVAGREIGKAAGTLSTLRQLGGAFGVAIAVAAFSHYGVRGTAHGFSDGFRAAMAALALLSLAGVLAASLLPVDPRAVLRPAHSQA